MVVQARWKETEIKGGLLVALEAGEKKLHQ